MLKFAFAFGILLSLPFAARAQSYGYDALLSHPAPAEDEITVVGLSVPGRGFVGSPKEICNCLGYSIVVSTKSKACTKGELFTWTQGVCERAEWITNESGHVWCGPDSWGAFNSHITSIVCRR